MPLNINIVRIKKYFSFFWKKNINFTLIVSFLFFFYLLRFVYIESLWHDEIHTLAFLRGIDVYPFSGSDFNNINKFKGSHWFKELINLDSFFINFKRNIIHEGHPPLYYVSLKAWTFFIGNNTLGIRSFSLFTSAISIIIFNKIINLLTSKNIKLLTLIFATSPFFIYFSFEARSYSLYLLLSLIVIYYFIKGIISDFSNSTFFKILFFSTLLLYTHYYGVFLLAPISVFLFFRLYKKSEYFKILLLSIPYVFLLIWVPIIILQTKVHVIHWTNGFLGFEESFFALFSSLETILSINIMRENDIYIVLALFSLMIINLSINNKRKNTFLLFIIGTLIIGFEVILFDFVLNHHTIAIPRYYIPILPLMVIFIGCIINNGKIKTVQKISLYSILFLFVTISFKIINGSLMQKQMYREVASFIDNNYSPKDTKIIISPNGPSVLGIAYYLNKNFKIKGVQPSNLLNYYKQDSIIIIQQRLGVNTEPWNIKNRPKNLDKRTIKFIGIDLVKKK